jgi:hypothetical protein
MSHSILIESATRLTLEPGCAIQLTGISAIGSDGRRAMNRISAPKAKPAVLCRGKNAAAASRRNILNPHYVSRIPSRASGLTRKSNVRPTERCPDLGPA